MSGAATQNWIEDLRRSVVPVPTRAEGKAAAQSDGAPNVVRPEFARREPPLGPGGRARPELAAALSSVLEAVESIRAAEERAADAERRMAELADQTLRDLAAAKEMIVEARAETAAVEERAEEAAQASAARDRAAEQQIQASQDHIDTLRGQIAALTGDLHQTKQALEDAEHRVFAAETRAMEAREDLTYLEAHIREQFGAPSAAGTGTAG